MTWNHRVVMEIDGDTGEPWFAICEVYYNGDGETCGYCAPCTGAETLEGLKIQVRRLAEALDKPILNANTDFTGRIEGEVNSDE